MIPLIGEMSAKQTKGCPNSENFAPAAYAPSRSGRKRRAIRESPLQPVGNGLDRSANLPIYWGGGARKARDGGVKYIKIHGRARRPAPTTGRRDADLHPLPLRGRWLLPQAKDGGREPEKSLPQSNATHLTAPSERGRKRRAIRESPLHAQNTIYRVGRGDSPDRGNVCEADKRVPEFGEFCPRRGV